MSPVYLFALCGVVRAQMAAPSPRLPLSSPTRDRSRRRLQLFDYAARKIPYLFIIGTKDAFFPLADVQATRDALKSRSFPVEYVEMSGQTHNYVRSAKEINGKAWEFLLKNPLPADPRYTVYSDPAQ